MKITWNELLNLLGDQQAFLAEDESGGNLVLVEYGGDVDAVEDLLNRVDIEGSPDENLVNFFKEGYYVDYDEEWSMCEVCNKWYRVDEVQTVDNGYTYICKECLSANAYDYLNDFINNADKAFPEVPTDLLDKDFMEEYNEKPFKLLTKVYVNGYYGRNDNPHKLLDSFINEYGCEEVIFALESVTPFEVEYRVMVR